MKSRQVTMVLLTRLVIMLTLLCAGTTARATMVASTSLADLTKHATLIFVGRCDQRETTLKPFLTGEVPVSKYTFSVTQVLRAPNDTAIAVGKPFVFEQQGGPLKPEQRKEGVLMPVGAVIYQVGQEYMLFLRATNNGIYSPIGLQQGRLTVTTDAGGRKHVGNGPYNPQLFKGIGHAGAATGRTLSKAAASIAKGEHKVGADGVAIETMTELVTALQGK